jgi:hypothetical protein
MLVSVANALLNVVGIPFPLHNQLLLLTLKPFLLELNDILFVLRIATVSADVISERLRPLPQREPCLRHPPITAAPMIHKVLHVGYSQPLASEILLLVHILQPQEYLLLDAHIGFLAVFLMKRQELKLELIDVAVVDELATLVMDRKLLGDQLCVL